MSDDAVDRIVHGKPDTSVKVGLALAGWDSTNDMYKQAAEALDWDLDAAAPPDLSSSIFDQIEGDASEGGLLGEDNQFVIDQRGYDVVTRHLASKYLEQNDSRKVLNSPVTNVTYSDNEVVVHTENGTCYRAEYGICTFSLGVLQQAISGQAPVSISPASPEWKVESIFGNVMGVYTKIFFQFDAKDVFWPKEIQYFFYASPTIRGYWIDWQSFDFPGSPLEGSGISFATMAWDQSKRVEQQSDDETMQEGLAVLKQMFPNVTIPTPRDFLYPRWGTTPWSFGSYSSWAAEYTLEDNTNFRANLGRLWFAGAATSSEFFGYLHGAFFEGQIAGEEVAACAKDPQNCAGRMRYTNLGGEAEGNYNASNGFQYPIDEVLQND